MADQQRGDAVPLPDGDAAAIRRRGRGARRVAPSPARLARDRAVAARLVTAAVFAVWTVGIEARLLYLQVFAREPDGARRQPADANGRSAGQARRHRRPQRPSARVQRRRRVGLADPAEVETPDAAAARCLRALDECDARRSKAALGTTRAEARFVFARARRPRRGAHRGSTSRAVGSPGEPPVLSEARAAVARARLRRHDNDGSPARAPRTTRGDRGRPARRSSTSDAHRRAVTSRVERAGHVRCRPRADHRSVFCRTSPSASCARGVQENRAAGGSAIVMDPTTGEILALANWPTFNPNASAAAAEELRRNRAVRTSTSRARRSRSSPPRRRSKKA